VKRASGGFTILDGAGLQSLQSEWFCSRMTLRRAEGARVTWSITCDVTARLLEVRLLNSTHIYLPSKTLEQYDSIGTNI